MSATDRPHGRAVFLDSESSWADALRDVGADALMMKRAGAHGGAFWGEELPLMATWAFGR